MPVEKDIKKESAKGKPYPPAYFMSLTLENIRCFGEKQTLDLLDGKGRPAQWTVILGDNGVGKTTLLQCLVANEAILLGEELIPKFLMFSEIQSDIDYILRLGSNNGLIQSKIFTGCKLKDAQVGEIIDNCMIEIPRGTNIVHWEADGRSLGINCYGYGASRRLSQSTLKEKIVAPSESLFKDNAHLLNAEEWILRADYAASKESDFRMFAQKKLDEVKKLLVKVLPDVENIRFWIPNDKNQKPKVAFETFSGTVQLNDLSLGYKTMIAWMVDLAARLYERYPDSPDPLAEPAVVLVDEIDLHMHPKWQRNIKDYLIERFPNTQFIVTAHSPLIVQEATDANVVLLKREGDHVEIYRNPEIIKGWRLDQIYNSNLFGNVGSRSKEIQKLLDERSAILTKPKLTKMDIKKVEKLEAQIGYLPTGETREDIEARNIIREAAAQLKKAKG
ncbi:MAG: AAA family ATPase [Candidatus Hatepunaea meridiana]|nr:AAA family ATPase [Candidatus Hatepunaea meridiana]